MTTKRTVLLLAILLTFSLLLVSCDFGKTIDKNLVGNWTTSLDTVDPELSGISEEDCEMIGIDIKDIKYAMSFNKDGSGKLAMRLDDENAPDDIKEIFAEDEDASFEWYTIGDTLYITYADEEELNATDYKISGNKLTMTDDDGTTMTLTKELLSLEK